MASDRHNSGLPENVHYDPERERRNRAAVKAKLEEKWGPDDPSINPAFAASTSAAHETASRRSTTDVASYDATAWNLQPLDDVLDGSFEPERTTILKRSDGIALLYAGKTHMLLGESESGKSWTALFAAAEVLNDGGGVLYLDFESDRGTIVSRLVMLGVSTDAIRANFGYAQPSGDPEKGSPEAVQARLSAFRTLLAQPWRLVIIDAMTEAMMEYELDGYLPDQVARFHKKLPNQFANAGAAAVMIDHVVKAHDGRGRFAQGSQHKISGLTGAAYVVEPKSAIAPGKSGEIVLRVAKDRPGFVRQHSAKWRDDRTQESARITFDTSETTEGRLFGKSGVYEVKPPERYDPETGTVSEWKPTVLMGRVAEYVKNHPGTTRYKIKNEVSGTNKDLLKAIDCLLLDDYLVEQPGKREGSTGLYLARPYPSQ